MRNGLTTLLMAICAAATILRTMVDAEASTGNVLLVATLRLTLPPGTAADPSAVTPTELTGEPVAFWWDQSALHMGDRVFPWRDLHVTPTNGATFSIDLRRDAFREKNSVEGRIDLSASKYRVSAFGPIGGRDVHGRVEIVPAADGTVFSRLYASGETQDYINAVKTRKVRKGAKAVIDVVGRGSSSGAGIYTLKDTDGKILCSFTGAYRDPAYPFDYKTIRTDAAKRVLNVRTAGWTDDPGCTLRITARDLMTDTIDVWTKAVALGPIWGERTYPVDVADLPSGFYRLHFDYLDAAGACVHSDAEEYLKPAPKMPWEGNTLGAEDTVPPPWTPPAFSEDGTFRCWNRTVRLGGAGLVSSIVNKDREMLTAPSTLVADGLAMTFDVRCVEKKASEATYLLSAREAPVAVRATCEFDGYIRFDATFPTSVTSLVWTVAADRAGANGFDDCSSEKNANAYIPRGRDLSFDFNPDAVRRWWLPGTRGLMGGYLSLRGWHARHLKKAGRVEASEREIRVTTRFVDEPMTAGADRTVSFYLEPTPVKPKNLALAALDQSRVVTWTGHVFKHFETKYPGFADPVRIKNYTDRIKRGDRVFWYNATHGASPTDPFWGWYAADWNQRGLGYWAREAPSATRKKASWCYACPGSGSYRDFKVYAINHALNEAIPEAKDLYFDLAAPKNCSNAKHGCRFTDDFGRTIRDVPIAAVRDIHKRAYRLVKRKNPDGCLKGHIAASMCPSDVFFDMITACEGVAYDVLKNCFTYYDIFTPELMRSFYVPRTQEYVFNAVPQLARARECWAPDLLRTYDPTCPEEERPIRHAAAYFKICDIVLSATPNDRRGPQFYTVDSAIRRLRQGGVYNAFYMDGQKPLVTLSSPGARQLWAWFAKGREGVLVLLNDTDASVRQTVSVVGVRTKGREILSGRTYDFSSGDCVFDLGPREACFVAFDRF